MRKVFLAIFRNIYLSANFLTYYPSQTWNSVYSRHYSSLVAGDMMDGERLRDLANVVASMEVSFPSTFFLLVASSLKSDPHLLKIYFFDENHLKWYKILFILSWKVFISQGIWTVALIFWWRKKSGLIRKLRVISTFVTSQPG